MKLKCLSILVLVLSMSSGVFAQSKYDNTYKIRESKITDSVPEGVAIISGYVKTERSKPPIIYIAFQRHDEIGMDFKTAYINSKGWFALRMPPQKGILYAYTVEGKEIVLPMKDYENRSWTKVDFYSNDREKKLPPPPEPEVPEFVAPTPVEKPVIYVYSDSIQEMDLAIRMEENMFRDFHTKHKGEITFTYPEYNDGWHVKVGPNGIEDKGKKYPYLFWEAEFEDFSFKVGEGGYPVTIIRTDTVVDFLESSLTKLGLNYQEKADFITYWAPRMLKHDTVAVQFLTGADYDYHVAYLETKPEPKNKLRVYMIFKKVDFTIGMYSEQKIEPIDFKRDGLTLVEWGGSEIDPSVNLPWLSLSICEGYTAELKEDSCKYNKYNNLFGPRIEWNEKKKVLNVFPKPYSDLSYQIPGEETGLDRLNLEDPCKCYTYDDLFGPRLEWDEKKKVLNVVPSPYAHLLYEYSDKDIDLDQLDLDDLDLEDE